MIRRNSVISIGSVLLLLNYGIYGSILSSLKPSGFPKLIEHQLETKWKSDDLSKDPNIPGVCRQLEMHIIETSLRGRMTETECGLAGYLNILFVQNSLNVS